MPVTKTKMKAKMKAKPKSKKMAMDPRLTKALKSAPHGKKMLEIPTVRSAKAVGRGLSK